MSAATENSLHALSAAEADQLIDRLERDCPPLEEKNGLVQPVDPRAFSEAELAWMSRDRLMMARLLLLQEQEAESSQALKEEVGRKAQARRIAASLGPVGSVPSAPESKVADADRSADRQPATATAPTDPQQASNHGRADGKGTDAARSPPPEPRQEMDDRTRQAIAARLAAQRNQGR